MRLENRCHKIVTVLVLGLICLLLDTGDALIVEHTVNDRYWGDGGDGSGKNMLGRILMEIRTELAQGGR